MKTKHNEKIDNLKQEYMAKEMSEEQINAMMQDNSLKYDAERRKNFLTENSWSARVAAIEQIVSK